MKQYFFTALVIFLAIDSGVCPMTAGQPKENGEEEKLQSPLAALYEQVLQQAINECGFESPLVTSLTAAYEWTGQGSIPPQDFKKKRQAFEKVVKKLKMRSFSKLLQASLKKLNKEGKKVGAMPGWKKGVISASVITALIVIAASRSYIQKKDRIAATDVSRRLVRPLSGSPVQRGLLLSPEGRDRLGLRVDSDPAAQAAASGSAADRPYGMPRAYKIQEGTVPFGALSFFRYGHSNVPYESPSMLFEDHEIEPLSDGEIRFFGVRLKHTGNPIGIACGKPFHKSYLFKVSINGASQDMIVYNPGNGSEPSYRFIIRSEDPEVHLQEGTNVIVYRGIHLTGVTPRGAYSYSAI